MEKRSLDRLPPNSPEAEMAVLGCVLIDPPRLAICIEALKGLGEEFYDLKNRTIYDTMLELYEDGAPLDIVSLQDRLKVWEKLEQVGGLSYLMTLPDASPSAENIDYYLELLKEKYVMRRMIQTCTEVVGKIFDHQGDVDTLMDECERDVLRISESRSETQGASIPALVHQVLTDIEFARDHQGTPTGITCGFTDLDKMTGGLQPGDVIVLAARPSMGKSSLAMNIAEHVACDLHLGVGVISLEMTGKALIARMLGSRSRVNLRDMRDGYLRDEDYPKIANASGNIIHAPLYIDDTGGQSILAIRAKMRRWWQQHHIKLGIIDYLQLANALGSKRRFESRQQEVADISVGIKNLAKELNIPIIALSQLNRDVERDKNRKPRLSDLRESGSLEQDADIVWMLYKPRADDDYEENAAYPVNLLVAKNRNGPTGEVNLTFLRTITRFESAAKVSDDDVPHQPQPALPYAEEHEYTQPT